ncbi:hypothetical protein Tsubulata_033976 [Turnera subulata]|uniref:Peptidase A1 domain-containing protein n=1 Tax=Turnera subulata TaxID=218843 RepID=A0A9Q0FGP7_9ROSI|nr:hypothetical protein Tsubulata_033976 [Turnera subulata]
MLYMVTNTLPLSAANHNASSSPTIMLPIYHISKFLETNYTNNESFSLARLGRDETTQATRYPNTTLLKSTGEYVVEIGLGSEGLIAHLLFDTGSSFMWWQCLPSSSCYNREDTFYDSELSGTYQEVNCFDEVCNIELPFIDGCLDEEEVCNYKIQYSDNRRSIGIMANDKVSNEDGSWSEYVYFCCGRNNTGDAFHGTYSGVLGFALDPYSFPFQVGATRFSFCLDSIENDGSALYLHKIPTFQNDDVAFVVPLLHSSTRPQAYYLGLKGITIAGKKVPISANKWKINSAGQYGVMIDSGTLITRFPGEVYEEIRNQFVKEVWAYEPSSNKVHNMLDTCYEIDGHSVDDFPTMSFHFGDGMAIRLNPKPDYVSYKVWHVLSSFCCYASD